MLCNANKIYDVPSYACLPMKYVFGIMDRFL